MNNRLVHSDVDTNYPFPKPSTAATGVSNFQGLRNFALNLVRIDRVLAINLHTSRPWKENFSRQIEQFDFCFVYVARWYLRCLSNSNSGKLQGEHLPGGDCWSFIRRLSGDQREMANWELATCLLCLWQRHLLY